MEAIMARELSKFGVEVDLNTENKSIDVRLFERVDEDREVRDTRSYNINDLPPEIRVRSDLYGGSKILQDRTSSESKNPERLSSMDDVWTRLCAGQWEKERESTGPTVSAEVEALARLKGVSVADIQKSLRSRYDAEKREEILNHPKVKELADEIRAAREAEDVNFDDLIA
jgi:hypothetical protein